MALDHDPIRASDAVIQRLRANHPVLIDLTTGRVERLLAALGHPEKFIDFAYRSEHEMTVKAKAIVDGYYGRAPQRSGCSSAGRISISPRLRFSRPWASRRCSCA